MNIKANNDDVVVYMQSAVQWIKGRSRWTEDV